MLSMIGLSSARALANASSPHGYQSTGLWACCKRYGLVSLISRLAMEPRFEESSEPLFGSPRFVSPQGLVRASRPGPSDGRSLTASSAGPSDRRSLDARSLQP